MTWVEISTGEELDMGSEFDFFGRNSKPWHQFNYC
ncbi:MAG: hypothetical protein ACOX2A_06180 [Tepidanaerobacteraceae bacterium]